MSSISNTIPVGSDYVPFKWEGDVLHAYFYKCNAWLPVRKTLKKNRYGDVVFERC